MIYVVEVHKNRHLVRKVRAEADHEEAPIIEVKEDASLDQGEGDQGREGVLSGYIVEGGLIVFTNELNVGCEGCENVFLLYPNSTRDTSQTGAAWGLWSETFSTAQ